MLTLVTSSMKKRIIFSLSILTILLSIACIDRTAYDALLVEVDSLMTLHPNSGVCILQGIPSSKLKTQAARAYHALLLAKTQDKNYIVVDDSLIQEAVQYYGTHGDVVKQAQAYYLLGNYYRNKNDYSQAINKYTTALSYIDDHSGSADLKAVLYSNLGYLYYTQSLNVEADSIYQQAELWAKLQSDTVSLCYFLSQRGMISLRKGEKHYPVAEQRLLQALSVGKACSDSNVLIPVYHSLSMYYSLIYKPEQALKYARLNYSNLKDTLHCYSTFLLLGNAYFINNQYDSASIFLQKVLEAERYYDAKADVCMRLSEIAQIKGNMETSIYLERKRAMYQDSAHQQSHNILRDIIARERSNNDAIYRRSARTRYALCAVFITINIFCIYYFRKKLLQHKAERKEWKEKMQTVKKRTYREEAYKTSALYAKVCRIAKELTKVETKENLDEDEWCQFITLTDAEWYGVVTSLDKKYRLSAEEIRICCLYLAQVPVTHMGHFLQIQSRSTIQNKSKSILLKIEAPQGFLLKDALFSLANQLKNKN